MKALRDRQQPARGRGLSLQAVLAGGLVAMGLLLAGDRACGQEEMAPPPAVYSGQVFTPPDLTHYTVESESNFLEKLRQVPRPGVTASEVHLPQEPPVATAAYSPRTWPPLQETAEPGYICHGRLYFEEINSERYGWDLGLLHPVLSAGVFYWNVLTLPYHMGTEPCRRYECSAGYCLPGDPVPLLLYPPEPSFTGALSEAAVIGVLAVIFP